jgi:hypothetical protein
MNPVDGCLLNPQRALHQLFYFHDACVDGHDDRAQRHEHCANRRAQNDAKSRQGIRGFHCHIGACTDCDASPVPLLFMLQLQFHGNELEKVLQRDHSHKLFSLNHHEPAYAVSPHETEHLYRIPVG